MMKRAIRKIGTLLSTDSKLRSDKGLITRVCDFIYKVSVMQIGGVAHRLSMRRIEVKIYCDPARGRFFFRFWVHRANVLIRVQNIG